MSISRAKWLIKHRDFNYIRVGGLAPRILILSSKHPSRFIARVGVLGTYREETRWAADRVCWNSDETTLCRGEGVLGDSEERGAFILWGQAVPEWGMGPDNWNLPVHRCDSLQTGNRK